MTTTERHTPIGLMIAIILSAVMVWRVSALTYLPLVGNEIPEFWGIAFRGDTFIGFTALIVAFLLWRVRNLDIWMLGIAWQVLGLADLYVAIESQSIHSLGAAPNFVVPTGMVMHGVALILIWRNRASYMPAHQG